MTGGASVVVCGAGPAGSAAAVLLAARGATVTLLDRVADPAAVGAGLLLQPNGLAVLYGLGLRDHLRTCAHASAGAALRDDRGRALAEARCPNFGNGLDHVLTVRRSHLAHVLDEAVRAWGTVDAINGANVIGADPSGTVTYQRDGREHSLTADLVVGADGVHSVVRDSGQFGARVVTTGHRYLRGIVPGAPNTPVAEYWTSLGLFGCSPLGDGATYVYANASAPPVREALARSDDAAFRSAWSRALPVVAPLVEGISLLDDVLVNDVEQVDCDRYTDGRLVLIGDAAHAMAPTLGQGANSALVDAAVLALELGQSGDLGEGCAAYSRRRRSPVRRVQRDAARLARLSAVEAAAGRRLRNTLLRAVSRPGLIERRFRAAQQEDPADLARGVRGLFAPA